MGLRDRFYTPATAKAILSWRILLGLGAGAGSAAAGLPVVAALGVGAGVYAASVAAAMPRAEKRPPIDPFVVGEPWRRLVQGAQGSARRLRETIDGVDAGPLRERLESIAERLEHGLHEAWAVARRGDEIDDALRRLDPTGLRSRLESARRRAGADPSSEAEAAVVSLESQLASAERLRQLSEETAASLRLTQIRLDELVARASEVRVGVVDTETYEREVSDLVLQLEALHLAVEETRPS